MGRTAHCFYWSALGCPGQETQRRQGREGSVRAALRLEGSRAVVVLGRLRVGLVHSSVELSQ